MRFILRCTDPWTSPWYICILYYDARIHEHHRDTFAFYITMHGSMNITVIHLYFILRCTDPWTSPWYICILYHDARIHEHHRDTFVFYITMHGSMNITVIYLYFISRFTDPWTSPWYICILYHDARIHEHHRDTFVCKNTLRIETMSAMIKRRINIFRLHFHQWNSEGQNCVLSTPWTSQSDSTGVGSA